MTTRIRWEETGYARFSGHVGTMEPFAFQIFRPATPQWILTSALPGMLGDVRYSDDVDVLKAEAEKWLERFVSSLGAVFLEPGFEFEDDGEPLEVKYAPGNRVRFAHPDYGYPGEQAPAAEHLTAGEVYTIAMFQIGQSRTDLILEGIPGEWFNSVFFEPADDEAAATAAAREE